MVDHVLVVLSERRMPRAVQLEDVLAKSQVMQRFSKPPVLEGLDRHPARDPDGCGLGQPWVSSIAPSPWKRKVVQAHIPTNSLIE
jgi:hypothetical protein